jgi:hypothetical protein
MIQLIVAVLIVFLVAIYPVMLAARMVGAGRTGPGAALFAILLQAIFGIEIRLVVNDPLLQGIAAVLVGCAIYSFILQTTVLRGFAISVIAIVIVVLGLLLVAGFGAALGI